MFMLNGKEIKYDLDDLDELRKAINAHKEEGRKLISHFNKMQEYYSDWEDRLVEIDNAVERIKKEHGISRDEIVEPEKTEIDNFLDGVLDL